MDTNGLRVAGAIAITVAFLFGYNWFIYDLMNAKFNSIEDLLEYTIRMNGIKLMMFVGYAVTNWVLVKSYRSEFEFQVWFTGIFSLIFIFVKTVLHYFHLLIISDLWDMITFTTVTIAFFIVMYKNAIVYKLYR